MAISGIVLNIYKHEIIINPLQFDEVVCTINCALSFSNLVELTFPTV